MHDATSRTHERGRVGRPCSLTAPERQERLLRAAEEAFMELGFGATSMEHIARRAGMSKRTLYSFYPDKSTIFTAVVGVLNDFPRNSPLPTTSDKRILVQALRQRTIDIAAFAISERQVRLTRLIIAEAINHPELASLFQDKVVSRAVGYLVEGMRALQSVEPALKAYDAEWMGMTIYTSSVGNLHLQRLFGTATTEDLFRVEKRIDSAMGLFGIKPE
ncbi:TetR/AcrR family transcriptional regulator [Delftia sp. HK171]|uniref:TetR/AcrR family transcriptional regulator n=1 Tax=Delftia sp. HK171 TaxID=1920191 RepID=UPI0011506DA1|nr:TetR/AcrR family transcriptional regulator [Delftia sp. HK171]TQL81187.1 TetR family transcriptional regulator [Delftia sp. HK171]